MADSDAVLELDGVVASNNSALEAGGFLSLWNNATAKVLRSNFTAHSAGEGGGFAFCGSNTALLLDTVRIEFACTGLMGGSFRLVSRASLTATNLVVTYSGAMRGGFIYMHDSTTATLKLTSAQFALSQSEGGAFYLNSEAKLYVDDSNRGRRVHGWASVG
eukprot:Opistho-2@8825